MDQQKIKTLKKKKNFDKLKTIKVKTLINMQRHNVLQAHIGEIISPQLSQPPASNLKIKVLSQASLTSLKSEFSKDSSSTSLTGIPIGRVSFLAPQSPVESLLPIFQDLTARRRSKSENSIFKQNLFLPAEDEHTDATTPSIESLNSPVITEKSSNADINSESNLNVKIKERVLTMCIESNLTISNENFNYSELYLEDFSVIAKAAVEIPVVNTNRISIYTGEFLKLYDEPEQDLATIVNTPTKQTASRKSRVFQEERKDSNATDTTLFYTPVTLNRHSDLPEDKPLKVVNKILEVDNKPTKKARSVLASNFEENMTKSRISEVTQSVPHLEPLNIVEEDKVDDKEEFRKTSKSFIRSNKSLNENIGLGGRSLSFRLKKPEKQTHTPEIQKESKLKSFFKPKSSR